MSELDRIRVHGDAMGMMWRRGAILVAMGLVVGTAPVGIDLGAQASSEDSVERVPGEVVAIFEEEVPDDLDVRVGDYGEVKLENESLRFGVVNTSDDQVDDVIAELESYNDTEQAYQPAYVKSTFQPNDQRFSDQWGLQENYTDVPGAWNHSLEAGAGLGSRDIVVAVLDNGINDHVDLGDAVSEGALDCGENAEFNHEPAGSPHGTPIAGIIAAATDNSTGIAGTSQSCLLDIKVSGNSSLCYTDSPCGTAYDLALGIDHARLQGADVISISQVTGDDDDLVEEAVSRANDADIPQVAGAGNVQKQCPEGNAGYPAEYKETIAVTNTDENKSVVVGCTSRVAITLTAPGEEVPSIEGTEEYGTFRGTSYAVPHVSGTIALMQSTALASNRTDGELSADTVRCVLAGTADELDGHAEKEQGSGLLDVEESVELAKDPQERDRSGC